MAEYVVFRDHSALVGLVIVNLTGGQLISDSEFDISALTAAGFELAAVAGPGGTVAQFLRRDGEWQIPGGGGGGGLPPDGGYGDISVSAGGTDWRINANVVSDSKLRDASGTSVIGRSANTVGDPGDIVAGVDGDVLRRAGGALAFGAIPQGSVTSLVADLANKAALVHTHSESDVTGLVADLAGKAAVVHGHAAGDITGLATIATSGSASDLGTGTIPIARIGANQVDGTKLFRGATAGHVLTSNGPGADPTYQAGGGGGGLTFQQASAIASLRP